MTDLNAKNVPASKILKDAGLTKEAKADYNLHVMLIQKQDGVNPAQARMISYLEGKQGLSKRLGQKELPV